VKDDDEELWSFWDQCAEQGFKRNGTYLRGNVIPTRLPVVDIEKGAIL